MRKFHDNFGRSIGVEKNGESTSIFLFNDSGMNKLGDVSQGVFHPDDICYRNGGLFLSAKFMLDARAFEFIGIKIGEKCVLIKKIIMELTLGINRLNSYSYGQMVRFDLAMIDSLSESEFKEIVRLSELYLEYVLKNCTDSEIQITGCEKTNNPKQTAMSLSSTAINYANMKSPISLPYFYKLQNLYIKCQKQGQ